MSAGELVRFNVRRTARGAWLATAMVPTRDGRHVRARAIVTIGEAMRVIPRGVGMSFKSLLRTAKRAAKKLAVMKALKMAARIARMPGLSLLIPPQVTMALRLADRASRLARSARGGNAAAKKRWQSTVSLIRRNGDTRALAAMRLAHSITAEC